MGMVRADDDRHGPMKHGPMELGTANDDAIYGAVEGPIKIGIVVYEMRQGGSQAQKII